MMATININFDQTLGRIKPMHAVGQPPISGISTECFHFLKEAHIPFSRLHDVGGWFGGNLFVDIPNIFRNFDADVNAPESYDFAFTDILLKGLIDNGVEPYFRLGVTIENFHEIKSYRVFPPEDFQKWAEICEHIIRHYNEGWADGFNYGITYWEIWNEPEQNAMWKDTPEQYFDLYRVTSRHLRKCFGNSIKIGGYASCGFYAALDEQIISGEALGTTRKLTDWDKLLMGLIRFFNSFVDFVKKESLPFDFFSYHSYGNVKDTLIMQKYCENALEKAGFANVEIHLNEWNTDASFELLGSSKACADAVALMCEMQDTKMELMCFYDAQMNASAYGGMFNAYTRSPVTLYYGFKAFGELYIMGTEVYSQCDNDDIYVVAAKGEDKKGILITNIGEDINVTIDISKYQKAYLIDENHHFTETEININGFELKKYQTVYFEA